MTLIVAVGYAIVPSVFRSTVVNGETLLKSFLFVPCYAGQGKIFPVYSVGWTLNLEMFVYVVFFLSMKVSHRWRGLIATGTLVVLVALGMAYHPQNAIMNFWTQQRLLDFVLGIAVYGLQARHGRFKAPQACLLAIGAILLLQFSYKILLEEQYYLLCGMVLSTLLLLLCLPLEGMAVNRYLKRLGDMSYTLYLTHFFIIGMICRVLIDNAQISMMNTCIVAITIVLAVLVSWCVHLGFEKLVKKSLKK